MSEPLVKNSSALRLQPTPAVAGGAQTTSAPATVLQSQGRVPEAVPPPPDSARIFIGSAANENFPPDHLIAGRAQPKGSYGIWTAARSMHAARTLKDPITQHLIENYFRLSQAVRGAAKMPIFLQPQALVYVLDSLNLSEQARLSTLIANAAVALEQNQGHNAEVALNAGGDPVMLATIKNLNATVQHLKNEHKAAVRLALENHDGQGQLYGKNPYSTHLRKVRSVLKRFSLGPKDSLVGLRLGTVAWLHDICEDTQVSRVTLEAILGGDIAEIVACLTNEPERQGVSKEQQKRLTFERVARRLESRLVKLADRIANVEESLTNFFLGEPTKIEKYYQEWPLFKQCLYRPDEAPAMWEHLQRLLADQAYARQFILCNAAV